MAKMRWRESNRCRWVGIRPAHQGEQVSAFGLVSNGTQIIYTVPVGKTFYLCAWIHDVYMGAAGNGQLLVYTDGGVLTYRLGIGAGTVLGVTHRLSGSCWPPMEFPAGYTVRLSSAAALVDSYGSIYGWVQ